MERMRLNKYLALCGICSRREADKLIEQGRVLVNGTVAVNGLQVSEADTILVNKKVIQGRTEKKVLAFYKPVGVTCTEKDRHAEKIITDMIQYPIRVTYAGRLDKDSEGLLILTNDGDLIDAMMRGANCHEKEYIVRVDKEITDVFLTKMSEGIYLKELDRKTRPCKVKKISKFVFEIILTQGVNRQIRRMCKECGFCVKGLKRIRVMNLLLGDLKPGEYREVTGDALEELYKGCNMQKA